MRAPNSLVDNNQIIQRGCACALFVKRGSRAKTEAARNYPTPVVNAKRAKPGQ